MSRFRSNSQLDDVIVEEGDNHFTGFDTRLDPALLKPGIAQFSQNMRMDDYSPQVRKGVDRLTDDTIVIGNALTLPFGLDAITPLSNDNPPYAITRVGQVATITLADAPAIAIADGTEVEISGAAQTEYNTGGNNQSSNPLIIGETYTIKTYLAIDDFASVGGPAVGSNGDHDGVSFVATGTVATWASSSILFRQTILTRLTDTTFTYTVTGTPTTPATLATQTSGSLKVGAEYEITAHTSGDFSNVGSVTNTLNEVFTATYDAITESSDPTAWGGDTLTRTAISMSPLLGALTDGVFATTLFSDSDNNKEYIASASLNKVTLINPDEIATTVVIPYDSGQVVEQGVNPEMVQVSNGLLIHRGKTLKALEWNGNVAGMTPRSVVSDVIVSNVATVTTLLEHGYTGGESIIISGAVESYFNGTFVITSVTSTTTFTHALVHADVSATGTIIATLSPEFTEVADTHLSTFLSMPQADFSTFHPYSRLIVPVRIITMPVTTINTTTTVATVTTTNDNGLKVGDVITFSGCSDANNNGTKTIVSTTSSTVFTFVSSVPAAAVGNDGGSSILITIDVRDQFIVSDIFDHRTYDQVTNMFRINRGSVDSLVAFLVYQEKFLIVLYKKSIHIVSGMHLDDLSASTVAQVTAETGCIARKSAMVIGNQMIFLSEQGVYMLEITPELNLRGQDTPLSIDIQDEFSKDSLNYNYIHKAVAVYYNNRYYLAVPSTGQTRNDIVYVYNFLNKKWESKDTFNGDNFIDNWVVAQKDGKDRLFSSSVDGAIQLWEELDHDEIGSDSTETEILGRLKTRTYNLGNSMDVKKFNRGNISLEVLNGDTLTVDAVTENPDSTVTSLSLNTITPEDVLKRFRINKRGTGVAIDINTTVGRPKIRSVSVGGTESQRSNKTFE